jgi:hypothetical protein
MKTIGFGCRTLFGAGVALLSAVAVAGVSDLTYVNSPPSGVAVSAGGATFTMTKAGDPAAAGLLHPRAMVVAEASPVKVAFDADDPKAEMLDVARIDRTGKGNFAKAETVKLTKSTIRLASVSVKTTTAAAARNELQTASFAGCPVEIVKDGKKVPVLVSGRCYKSGAREYGSVAIQLAAEGQCKFGDVVRKVYVADTNRNFEIGDVVVRKVADREYKLPDTCVIANAAGLLDAASCEATARMGEPVQVAGKWYTLTGGGMKIAAEPIAGSTGKLAIESPSWQAMLTCKEYNLSLKGGKEPVEIPVGEYQVLMFHLYRQADANNATPNLSGSYAKQVKIEAGKTVSLALGADITLTLNTEVTGDKARISAVMTDSAGSRIAALYGPGGKRPPAPEVEVVNKKGEVIHTGTLAYG